MTLAHEIAHDSGALRGKRYRWRTTFVVACQFQAALVAHHHNLVLNPSPIDCALPANQTESPSQPLHANSSQSRMRFAHHDRTGVIPQVEDTVASKGAAPNRDRSRPLQSARYTILVCWRDALQSRRCKRSKHYIALTVLVMHIATLQL